MKKAKVFAGLAAGLLALSNAALAGDTGDDGMLQLSDSQMDGISAGQSSVAGGWATALYGVVGSRSQSRTYSSGAVNYTSASSLNYAIGIDPSAGAYADSTF